MLRGRQQNWLKTGPFMVTSMDSCYWIFRHTLTICLVAWFLYWLNCSFVSGVHVSRAHSHHADMVLLKELVLEGWTIWRGRQGETSHPNISQRFLEPSQSLQIWAAHFHVVHVESHVAKPIRMFAHEKQAVPCSSHHLMLPIIFFWLTQLQTVSVW